MWWHCLRGRKISSTNSGGRAIWVFKYRGVGRDEVRLPFFRGGAGDELQFRVMGGKIRRPRFYVLRRANGCAGLNIGGRTDDGRE